MQSSANQNSWTFPPAFLNDCGKYSRKFPNSQAEIPHVFVRGWIHLNSTHGNVTLSPFSSHFYHSAHKKLSIPARDSCIQALLNACEMEFITADFGMYTCALCWEWRGQNLPPRITAWLHWGSLRHTWNGTQKQTLSCWGDAEDAITFQLF